MEIPTKRIFNTLTVSPDFADELPLLSTVNVAFQRNDHGSSTGQEHIANIAG